MIILENLVRGWRTLYLESEMMFTHRILRNFWESLDTGTKQSLRFLITRLMLTLPMAMLLPTQTMSESWLLESANWVLNSCCWQTCICSVWLLLPNHLPRLSYWPPEIQDAQPNPSHSKVSKCLLCSWLAVFTWEGSTCLSLHLPSSLFLVGEIGRLRLLWWFDWQLCS